MTRATTAKLNWYGDILLLAAAWLLAGCATTNFDVPREASYAISADEETELGAQVEQ